MEALWEDTRAPSVRVDGAGAVSRRRRPVKGDCSDLAGGAESGGSSERSVFLQLVCALPEAEGDLE